MDNPTLEFKLTIFSNHTISKEDLSKLVVEENCNIVGETWDGEVSKWNLSSTQSGVKEWDIEEDGNQGGLEEKTKVSKTVDHSLLR